jgi:putative adenylate-forming enzyme
VTEVRADYGRWNSLGLSDAELRTMADEAERGEAGSSVTAGWSTGTGGGTRGLFVATAAERADYLGQSLARLLPTRALLQRQRIALHLRAGSSLYSDVARGRIAFGHVPLHRAPNEALADLQEFDPTILIAPAHRLLAFAQAGAKFPALRHLFHGSEPMSPAERDLITAHFGLVPRGIWQATEGFLGAECEHGRLHLNEHSLAIALEPLANTSAFRPVITDLRRRSQPVVRLLGDDLIEPDPGPPCPCGYAGRTVLPVQGRVGDIWRFGDEAVLPRRVVETVETVLGAGPRWQAVAEMDRAVLRVAPDCDQANAAIAAAALGQLVPVPVDLAFDLPPWPGPKRHKVVGHG